MGYDRERALKAFYSKPNRKLEDVGKRFHFTKYDELKVSDHRLSYELKRIADSLEDLLIILERQDD